MIHTDIIKSLSEDELGMLLYIVNKIIPCVSWEIDANILKTYKYDFLAKNIVAARPKIIEEKLNIYQSLCLKLGIANQ